MWIDYHLNPPVMYMYPTPDQVYAVVYERFKQYDSITALSETIDVMNTTLPVIVKGLAYQLSHSYERSPEVKMALEQDFMEEKIKFLARNTDRVGSEIVAPRGTMIV